MRARAHFGFLTIFPFYVELVVDFKPEHVPGGGAKAREEKMMVVPWAPCAG